MTLPTRGPADFSHPNRSSSHNDIMMTMMMMARPSESEVEPTKLPSITVRPVELQHRPSSASSSSRCARKRDGNNLKFHNFVPNSEMALENSNDVYGHCLREEHGSKQIYVCNWRKQSPIIVDDRMAIAEKTSNSNSEKTTLGSSLTGYHIQNLLAAEQLENGQKSILQSLLVKHGCNVSIDKNLDEDDSVNNCDTVDCGDLRLKLNRRKPSTVRRVLRSDDSSNEEPLDLCVRKKLKTSGLKGEKSDLSKTVKCSESANLVPIMVSPASIGCHPEIPSSLVHTRPQTQSRDKKIIPATNFDNQINNHLINSPMIVSNPSIHNQLNQRPQTLSGSQDYRLTSSDNVYRRMYNQSNHANLLKDSSMNTLTSRSFSSVQLPPKNSVSSASFSPTNSNPVNGQPQTKAAKGRSSERSVIKRRLEDAFRTNGFLVKTKEVSDGDATFCKFRQLRKYTRYYLKSWHQHLPEEINKLWKGFLPPKTIKPATSSSSVLSSNSSNPQNPYCQQQVQAQPQTLPANRVLINDNNIASRQS